MEIRFPGLTRWFSPDGAVWLLHPNSWDLSFGYHPEMEKVGLARLGSVLLVESRSGTVTYRARGLMTRGGEEFLIRGTGDDDVFRIEDPTERIEGSP